MTVFALDIKRTNVRAFVSEKEARSHGNGFVFFTTADQLAADRNVTGRLLVDTYNNIANKPVKKFADNKKGAERILKEVSRMQPETPMFDKGEQPVDAITDNVVEVKVKSVNDKKKRGRASGYEGKMIKAACDKNPRRENTHGFNSMAILLNADGPVSYEDYLHAGGRRQDLAWDIEKGYAKVVG